MISEKERHQWITQILRALADLRACEQESARALGLDHMPNNELPSPPPEQVTHEKNL